MKLTLKGIDAVVRKLRKKYKEQGKSEEWLIGWSAGFVNRIAQQRRRNAMIKLKGSQIAVIPGVVDEVDYDGLKVHWEYQPEEKDVNVQEGVVVNAVFDGMGVDITGNASEEELDAIAQTILDGLYAGAEYEDEERWDRDWGDDVGIDMPEEDIW